MKYLIPFLFIGLLVCAFNSQAGVRFIVEDGESYYNDNWYEDTPSRIPHYEDTPTQAQRYGGRGTNCAEKGYSITHCSDGFYPANPCPDNLNYYKDCCPEEYIYSIDECYTMNKTPSSFSCGGKYACY